MKKLLLLCSLFLAPCAFAYQNYKDYDYYALEEYGLRHDTTRIEIYGGAAQPQSDWTHNGADVKLGNTGFSAGLAFVRNITPVFAIGIDGNYAGFASGDTVTRTTSLIFRPGVRPLPGIGDALLMQQEYKYSTGIATGLITGRINFFPSAKTRLYIPVGAGVGHMFVKQKFTNGEHDTTNSTSWALMAGLGLEFDIDETVIFGIEGRYNLIDLEDKLGDKIGKDRYHYLTALLKIGCRF